MPGRWQLFVVLLSIAWQLNLISEFLTNEDVTGRLEKGNIIFRSNYIPVLEPSTIYYSRPLVVCTSPPRFWHLEVSAVGWPSTGYPDTLLESRNSGKTIDEGKSLRIFLRLWRYVFCCIKNKKNGWRGWRWIFVCPAKYKGRGGGGMFLVPLLDSKQYLFPLIFIDWELN